MTAAAAATLAVHRSRKLIPDFRLHRPRSVAEAVAIRASIGRGAVYMAGGIDVVNRMKFGAPVTDLIYLGDLDGLDGIDADGDRLRLGALATHDRLATSPLIRSRLPALATTWPDVANIRVRCKGTIGGNIMAGDPAYDFALAALAAGARLHFAGSGGETAVDDPADAPEGALLTAVALPSDRTLRLFLDRSLRPIVSVAIGLDVAEGMVTGGRVAVGCAHAAPIMVKLPLDGPLRPPHLAELAVPLAAEVSSGLPEPSSDHHAGGTYRRRMVGVLVRRCLAGLP